jgi:gas vesicle protein
MRKLLSFILGVLSGVLVGAAAAMLLAPEAGERTRDEIQLRIDHIVDEGRRAAAERRAELEMQLEQLKRGRYPAT